ncbi:sensor histidine kinase [Paenisporosarcina sp. TG-14]|uniref:sensor histidine kinase n=1 Tax=Paenisporosarcina sp. TG-14 TaxID=1231057 RepID=UPI00035C7B50|nr:HAMP domain-containing sensor histidine kinase [Paenisporosarcina sp. TG-14]
MQLRKIEYQKNLGVKMNTLIKDVLLNVSLITIIILMWKFLTLKNQESHLFQKSSLAIAAIMSIMFCLSFPLVFQDQFQINFYHIPIGIAGLYGGATIGSILFVVTAPLLFLLGEDKFEISMILLVSQTLTIILLSPYFNRWKINNKMIIGTLLISIFSSVSIATTVNINPTDQVSLIIGLGVILVYLAFIAFCFFLIEKFNTSIETQKIVANAEKMEGLYHLAAAFGHEVRQPITTGKGMLQLLSDDSLPTDKRIEFLSAAISEVNRAEKIIQDYQVFAQPYSNKLERFDLVNEIQKVLNLVEPLTNVSNVQINTNLSSAWINGDKAKIERCLIHICTNSVEAMDSGGILTIQSFSTMENSIIEISDTGIGMTKKQISTLGEPLFSLSSRKGTGLGMMMVFRLVEGMKGKLEIQSKVGEGTKVTIVFPNEKLLKDAHTHIDKEFVY